MSFSGAGAGGETAKILTESCREQMSFESMVRVEEFFRSVDRRCIKTETGMLPKCLSVVSGTLRSFSRDVRRIHDDSYSQIVQLQERYTFREQLSVGKSGCCLSASQSLVSRFPP